jgi:hypothetical protein
MAMWATSQFYERGFIWLSSNMTRMLVNTTQPADGSSAVNDLLAGTSTGAAAMATTDFSISTGDVSGYKITVGTGSPFSNLPVPSSGTATHISLISSASSSLGYVTTCNSKSLTTSDTVTIPAWDIELRAPTSS